MSSILKALEKAEESQSVRRDGGAGGFKKRRDRRRPWVLPAAVLGGAAFAALATFAAMGGLSRGVTPVAKTDAIAAPPQAGVLTPPQVVEPLEKMPADAASAVAPQVGAGAAATEAVPVPPPVAVPVSKTDMDAVAKRVTGGAGRVVRSTPVRPAAASAEPAHAASGKTTRQQAPQVAAAQPAAAFKVAASAVRQQGGQVPVQPVAAQPAAFQKVAASPVQTAAVAEAAAPAKAAKTRPEIRVTGIAWQKDSALSGAIVNGRMLQQGGVVEGYRIDQILEDKVIFSGSGGKLEIPLGAGQ